MATWLAIPADDAERVTRALRLRTVLPANWQAGLADVESEGVFVTPAIEGWVLVVGQDLARATADSSKMEALLAPISEEFGLAMWFSTDEERDVHGWAFAERGELLRGYMYAEEHGHTFWHGEVTDVERELGCFVDDPRDQSDDEIKWWPDRQVVLQLARAWSVDPSCLRASDSLGASSSGWLGRL